LRQLLYFPVAKAAAPMEAAAVVAVEAVVVVEAGAAEGVELTLYLYTFKA